MSILTKRDILAMSADGETNTDILRAAVESGLAYPEAFRLVSDRLRLSPDEVREMRDNYADQV